LEHTLYLLRQQSAADAAITPLSLFFCLLLDIL
jgi:hypothetical protein